jgi:hypothetical protein
MKNKKEDGSNFGIQLLLDPSEFLSESFKEN